jgi:hypothetical protein
VSVFAAPSHAPWLHVLVDPHNLHFAVNEDNVYRKAHEKHVDRIAWLDPHAFVPIKFGASQQPSHARHVRRGDLEP